MKLMDLLNIIPVTEYLIIESYNGKRMALAYQISKPSDRTNIDQVDLHGEVMAVHSAVPGKYFSQKSGLVISVQMYQ